MTSAATAVGNSLLVERGVPTAAKDATVLRATVYRDEQPRPVILVRNPYGESMTRSVPVAPFTDAGFAVVIQDCRGCGLSDGDFEPFVHEESDTLDAIEWCASQPWSDGRVVMYGASYSGMVQFAAAVSAPAALRAIIPIVAPADYLTGVAYRGGAFQLGQLTGWFGLKSMQTIMHRRARGVDVAEQLQALGGHSRNPLGTMLHVPLSEAPLVSRVLPSWRTWLDEPRRGGFWRRLSYRDRRDGVAVPALHIGGWFDLFLGGTLDNFTTLAGEAATDRARAGQRLIIGPWSHTDQTGSVGELSFGMQASAQALGLEFIATQFALAALTVEADVPGPPVKIFVMGANSWRDEEEWPLARTEWTPLYLHAGGVLAVQPPQDPESAPTRYGFDPSNPTPTVGGQTLMTGGADGGVEWSPGPRDQRAVEARDDIVSFTGEMLATDVEVTGPISAKLFVSTTGEDADFVVRLVDVWPDGRALSVVAGITRASARSGQDAPADSVAPGETIEINVDLWATSQLFRAGHRIRIDVASGSFPEFDRNPGVRAAAADLRPEDLRCVTQSVFHDSLRASRVVLPVIPQ